MSEKIGVIHEVGDLGLGFEPLTEAERKSLDKQKKDKNNKKK